MTYKLMNDVALVSICGNNYLVATGEARGKVPYIEGITAPGAYFWRMLEQSIPVCDIITKAAEDYKCSEEKAKMAFDKLTNLLKNKGYLIFNEAEE